MGDVLGGVGDGMTRWVTRWAKSRHSGPTGGNCVEVAFLAGGRVAVRNSRDPDGLALVFPAAGWAAFVAKARDGEFG